jgi:sterol desaturase/sphingolipid hydroxylase (fatty acid hydroxylase superfamily)
MLVLISVPVYALVIGAEMIFSYFHHKKLYTTKGVLSNVYLTTLNMGLDILVRGICLFVLDYAFRFKVADLSFSPLLYWTVLILAEDFMFYWLHRVDHHCRLFWAVHVTHHSSQEFNLTVGFRSSVLQPLYRFIYFIPLALCGFKALDIMFAYSAAQIVGILAHTQTVDKLGFLEYIFVTPSHHRVHHASNVKYLDRNMGMLLIIWDKIFGTFVPEDKNEPIRYGLTHNVESDNPVTLVFHEWQQIGRDIRKEKLSWRDKLMYLLGPPGWSHDGSRKTSAQLRREMELTSRNGHHLSH